MTTWQIDPAHSNVEFAVKHLMLSTVKGRFADFTADLVLDDPGGASPRLDVTIETASIDTRQAQRDAHLRSADFFDAEHYPRLTFRSRRVDGPMDGEFRLVGDLTIRGVTKEVTLTARQEGSGKDPWGGERRSFSARGRIDRSDFGLRWNQALETGGFVVGDEVRVEIDTEFVRKAA